MPDKSQYILFALLALTAALSAMPPPPAQEYDYENPPQGLFVEEWMEMHLGGDKVGWSHTTFTRRGDEVRTKVESFMKMARGAIALEIKSTESTVETVQGRPLSFETLMNMSGQDIVSIGTVLDGKVSVTTKSPGYADTKEYSFPDGALMTWGLAQKTFREGFEPGTQYEVLLYTPSLNAQQALPGKVEVQPVESFNYRGRQMRGPKVVNTLTIGAAELVTDAWADKHGRLLVTKMNMMGMPMELVVVDQETALKDFVAPEFFISNLIQLKRSIPKDADEVTYALALKDGNITEALPPESDSQTVQVKGDAAWVTVRRLPHNSIGQEQPIPAGTHFVPYLQTNLVITSEDPAIQELADGVHIEKEESVLEKAYALTHFVNRFIEEKHLEVGFATASEVAENPQGDCSEHAVLLTALGRAEGIPSRIAAGLLYLPVYEGQKNVMGYHMWTQFYVGGQWLDFDATTDEKIASPTRLALHYSSLNEESLAELGLSLIDIIGNLKVSVESVKLTSDET